MKVISVRYLLFENEHVAALGLAAVLEAVQPGLDVQHVQVLGAHVEGVLGPDDLVLVDVEALEAHLVVARAAVPLLARPDRALAVRALEDRGDEDQDRNPPRSVQHRSHLCIIPYWSVRARPRPRLRALSRNCIAIDNRIFLRRRPRRRPTVWTASKKCKSSFRYFIFCLRVNVA